MPKITLPPTHKLSPHTLFKAFTGTFTHAHGKIHIPAKITLYIGPKNELVCLPYTPENLMAVGSILSLNRFLFKQGRYIVPPHRLEPLISICNVVGQRTIERIIKTNKL